MVNGMKFYVVESQRYMLLTTTMIVSCGQAIFSVLCSSQRNHCTDTGSLCGDCSLHYPGSQQGLFKY